VNAREEEILLQTQDAGETQDNETVRFEVLQ
jgi:hypothetical protein